MLPGTDVALYNGMLNHILAARPGEPRVHRGAGPSTSRRYARRSAPYTLEVAEKITGIPAELIRAGRRAVRPGAPNTSTLWAMGLTQHATGTDIVASLLNLLLCCGMIGRWGAAMIPIRGQNNVQGASDVGAIPFAYTDYRPVTDPANRAEYAARLGSAGRSRCRSRSGLMVTEMAQDGEPGPRACTSWGRTRCCPIPNVAHAEEWVRRLEFLAVQDLFLTETARWADVVLPGSSFAEKEGTFANTDRHIQLAPAGARPARRGAARPRHPDRPVQPARPPDPLPRTPARCDGRDRAGHSELARALLRQAAPRGRAAVSGAHPGFAGHRLPLRRPLPHARPAGRCWCRSSSCPPASCPTRSIPFVLNTGRQMYHWHTGTMTRRSTGLDSREPVPIVEMHPGGCERPGRARGRHGARHLAAGQPPDRGAGLATARLRGQVFIPMHFREAAVNLLTNPTLDPYAKIAEFKVSAVRIEAVTTL